MRAEPRVEPDALRDRDDVGAGRLAHVRDLVDERDTRHQEGVRGQLDHLRRVDVGAHDRRLEPVVERRDRGAVVLDERADHDAVGAHEVAHRAALGKELRVRGIADVIEPARVQTRADLLPRSDRNGRLHHEDRPTGQLGKLVDDAPHTRQISVARVGRRRVDAHEQELAVGDLVDVQREDQALGVALEQLRHPLLVERHLAPAQALDLVRDDVPDDHVVAELGEADARDEADPAGAEDAHPGHVANPTPLPSGA